MYLASRAASGWSKGVYRSPGPPSRGVVRLINLVGDERTRFSMISPKNAFPQPRSLTPRKRSSSKQGAPCRNKAPPCHHPMLPSSAALPLPRMAVDLAQGVVDANKAVGVHTLLVVPPLEEHLLLEPPDWETVAPIARTAGLCWGSVGNLPRCPPSGSGRYWRIEWPQPIAPPVRAEPAGSNCRFQSCWRRRHSTRRVEWCTCRPPGQS